MYADYEFYINSFAGKIIPAGEFTALSVKCERYLDYVTGHKITEPTDIVKSAVCVAAEALYDVIQRYKDIPHGIKSENTDGYSVTFADMDIATIREQQEEAMLSAFVQELSGTGLLYQGVT